MIREFSCERTYARCLSTLQTVCEHRAWDKTHSGVELKELGDIHDFAMDNDPAVLLGLVLGDFLEGVDSAHDEIGLRCVCDRLHSLLRHARSSATLLMRGSD